jgi:gliding motility-associated-like protein
MCFAVSEAQPPTIHSSSLNFRNVTCHGFTLDWVAGNGDSRVVWIREGKAIDVVPIKDETYNANANYGDGAVIGTDIYTVYAGTSNSVTVTGLTKGTTYHVAIFEFNDNSGSFEYLTGSGYGAKSIVTGNITANFTIDKTYQCLSGNDFTFNNSSSNNLGGAMSYKWEFGDGNSSNSTNVNHTYAVGGIFKVKLEASTTGCLTDTILEDTVVVPYVVDFELDTAFQLAGDTIQCYSGSNRFNIVNTSWLPNPPIYGLWDRSRNKWSSTLNHKGQEQDFDIVTNNYHGSIDIKLVKSRQVGKGALFCADSITKTYVILPPLIDSSRVSFSDSIMCLSDNQFTFQHTAPDVIQTNWVFGDGNFSSNNPAIHSYVSPGRYGVTCQVEDINGCKGSYTDTVEVVSAPNNFFTGLNSKYCEGDLPANLKPNLSGGLFFGNSLVNSMDSTFDPSMLGQFAVSYVYTIGSCRDTFTVNTEVLPNPTVDIGPDTLICTGTTITLSGDQPGLNYRWDDQSTDQTRTVNGPGLFWLEVDNGDCKARDSIDIVQVTLPRLELGNDTVICGGEILSFDIQADAGSILWNDDPTAGFRRSLVQSGKYVATVTHPCGIISDSVNVNILEAACDIFIPNAFSPNGDFLNEIFYPQGLFRFTSLTIFDEYGIILFESFEPGKGWDGTYRGEVCQQGTYYYMLRYQLPEDGQYVKKLAKGPIYLMR